MQKHNKNTYLYNPSGCLRLESLQYYLTDNLPIEQKKEVEDHLKDCVFCKEALEGIKESGSQKKITRTVHRIERRVHHRFGGLYGYRDRRLTRNKIQKKTFYYSAAASVLLIIGLLSYLNVEKNIEIPIISELDSRNVPAEKQDGIVLHDPFTGEEDQGALKVKKEKIDKPEGQDPEHNPKKPSREKPRPVPVEPYTEVEIWEEKELVQDNIELNNVPGIDIAVTDPPVSGKKQMPKSAKMMPVVNFEDESEAEEDVFIVVEEMPSFQGGGLEEFIKYVHEHVEYPEKAIENGIEGRVMVQFTVNKEGKTVNRKIVRSVDSILDKEALRVILSSPAWQPGKQRGKPVDVQFTIPVEFKLNQK